VDILKVEGFEYDVPPSMLYMGFSTLLLGFEIGWDGS
jgi:hypothetical protein